MSTPSPVLAFDNSTSLPRITAASHSPVEPPYGLSSPPSNSNILAQDYLAAQGSRSNYIQANQATSFSSTDYMNDETQGRPKVMAMPSPTSAGQPVQDLTSSTHSPHHPTVPQIELDTPSTAAPTPQETVSRWLLPSDTLPQAESSQKGQSFQGLNLDFPSKGLSEELGANNIKFSARGSMLLDGKKVSGAHHIISAKTMPVIREPRKSEPTIRKRAVSSIAERPKIRLMSTDEEQLSEKVRAFYEIGTDSVPDLDAQLVNAKKTNLRWQDAIEENGTSQLSNASRTTSMTDVSKLPPSPTIPREDNELAGGVEDWQDVDNADVDRYGFIIPKSPPSTADGKLNGIKRAPTSSGQGLQRVSTSLQMASDTPRRKHTVRRTPSNARSTKSERELRRTPSQQSFRSTMSTNTYRQQSTSRALANRLPHNRDRRVLDEAGDMLTLPRSTTSNGLQRVFTDDGSGTSAGAYTLASTPSARRKENEREEKWRRMAHPVPTQSGVVGGGMAFTFDTTSSKLVERTWKGIPDTWRATAWHCFLSASAKRHNKRYPWKQCLADDTLIEMFHEYQEHNSPDDVQIDIDVPRTISSHIMFRRRYRGGQRLLFRVLHAMSMHFADTGYVQGMAALAATLLAYYEEEKAFVMLVRLWELRGLEKLYKHGFGGLIEALDDFEKGWLGQGELRKKLDELMIGPTAYGTRWYLTLFNYSIPFPSQLRVWDVFMLLGDDESDGSLMPSPPHVNIDEEKDDRANFGTTLDVLHAASAALIDGMRGILLESDFENAMKVLTSWIPLRDEDVFMRVAKAEWKMNVQRRLQAQHGRKKS